jgi:hypothetical protein
MSDCNCSTIGKRGLPGQDGQSGTPGLPGLPGATGLPGTTVFPSLVMSFIDGTHGGEIVSNNYTFPFSSQNVNTPDTSWAAFDSKNSAWTLQPGTYSVTFFVPLRVTATTTTGVPTGTYVNLVDRITNTELGFQQTVGPVISNLGSITVGLSLQVYYKFPLSITQVQNVVIRFFTSNTNNNVILTPGLPVTSERGTWTIERLST